MNSTTCDDAAFGPTVHGCRKFDFTIAFEVYIFSIVPSTIFMLIVPLRLAFLSRFRAKVEGHPFRYSKLVSTSVRWTPPNQLH
jgi:ATP-binding cassette subfamily C (CFTR/MRP) protein 1